MKNIKLIYQLLRLCNGAFFIILSFSATAQVYNFKKITTKDGLANSNINNIIETKNGFLWFATQGGGLSRFDGKEFKNYTKKDGLVSNDITSLVEDNNNNLWIGTTEGLCIFNGSTFKKITGQDSCLVNVTIYNMICDTKGDIWIPTFGAGLKIFRNNKFISIDTARQLGTNNFFSVVQLKNNEYLVGTYKSGLYKLDENGKVLKKFKDIGNNPATSAFSMCASATGEVYIGTNNSGVYKFFNNIISHLEIPEISNDLIGSILIDTKKNLWIGSEHGLVKSSSSGIKFYIESHGLSSEVIQALHEDYEGNIWIGTSGGGVNLLKRESIFTYSSLDGLTNNIVSSIFRTKEGDLLIGSLHGGLNIFNEKINKFKKYKLPKELEKTSISCYQELNNNLIVMGTEESGLLIFKKINGDFKLLKRITDYKTETETVYVNTILKIVKDKDNKVWVASYGHGIFEMNLDGEIVAHYGSGSNGLLTNEISTIGLDKNKNLYVAAYKLGIQYLKNNKFISLANNPPEILNICWSIQTDEAGVMYFGTQDGGVVVYKNNKFSIINTKNGLCANYIQSISIYKNTIWIGTDKGVNKIILNPDAKNIDSSLIKEIRFYNSDDGFVSAEINLNSIHSDKSGDIWFGTANGLTKYIEKLDYPNFVPPKLILADIKLFYDPVDWRKFSDSVDIKTNIPINLSLAYNKNHLTFNFRAITMDNVKYKFILENLDDVWSPYSIDDQAVYTNIPPGKYTFKVIAKNSFGIESKEMIEFNFTIKPPFWKTWWFYTFIIFLSLGSMISFFKWRTSRLQKEKLVLEQKVTARTTELIAANKQISVVLRDIKDSINYAERIQRAMMPIQEKIQQYLPDSFILFRPRDIVSGDFYWFNHKDDVEYIAAVDCTGHGVPGAFMSMVGSSVLNEIVLTKEFKDPSEILSQLNIGVQNALKQRENKTRDGMDLAFCAIDYKNKKITYAGANRSLYIFRKDKDTFVLQEIKATKCSIGGFTDETQIFKHHEINLKEGDTIYLHSDGYADQFGGPKGKKLMTSQFKEILSDVQNYKMYEQKELLEKKIEMWMANKHEQVDDMLVIGIKF